MLTENADCKKRPLVKFFQYTGIFSVSRGSPRATNKQLDTILNIIEKDTLEEMKSAGLRLRKVLQKDDQNVTDESVLDIAASFDGTCAKRGHTSLFGIVFVISVDTGEVLNYHVLSKFCKKKNQKKPKLKLFSLGSKTNDDSFKYAE